MLFLYLIAQHFFLGAAFHTPSLSFITCNFFTFAANRKITLSSSNSKTWCNTKSTSSDKSSIIAQNMRSATARLENSLTTSGTTSTSLANTSFFKMRQRSSTSGSSSVTSRSIDTGATTLNIPPVGKINHPDFSEGCELTLSEDQDPFAFDEGDFEPSKWELLSQKEKKSRAKKGVVKFRDLENGCKSQAMTNEKESIGGESHHLNEISCLTPFNEEGFSLVADCLLTSIKVYLYYLNFPLALFTRSFSLSFGMLKFRIIIELNIFYLDT